MTAATLTISSKNYSSWSLRGWLLCKMAGLDVEERVGAEERRAALLAAQVGAGVGVEALHEGVVSRPCQALGLQDPQVQQDAGAV